MVEGSEADLAALVAALREVVAAAPTPPSERSLAERLGVKRHRLRQALHALRQAGELPPPPPRREARQAGMALLAGTAPALARQTNPLEVMELRLALEPAGARLAALRATPYDIQRIEQAATTRVGADFAAADLAFHLAVTEAARNGLAALFYGLLRQVGAEARMHLPEHAQEAFGAARVAARDAEHRAVAATIAARDPDRAEAAMRGHLRAVQQKLLAGLVAPG